MRTAILALLLPLTAAVATAEQMSFVPEKHYDLTLDVKSGEYDDDIKALNSDGPSALRATLTIRKLDRTPTGWGSRFGFSVVGDNAVVAALQVDAGAHSALTLTLRMVSGTTEKTSRTFKFTPELGEPFTVELSWTQTGDVTASVNANNATETQNVRIGAPPKELRVTASGGRVEFAPIELGHRNSK